MSNKDKATEQDEEEQAQLAATKVSEGADKSVFLQKLAQMKPKEKTAEEKADFDNRFDKLLEKIKARQNK